MTRRNTASTRLLAEVAASLDAPTELLPHLPRLFADLSSLGSSPRRITSWLAAAGLAPGSTVIDLGCGKGAAAVSIARRLRARVTGIDAFAPFIDAAVQLASDQTVSELCTFRTGDYSRARRPAPPTRGYDAGLMLGVAPVDVAAPLLHRLVRPGGCYIIDDAVWLGPDDHPTVPHLEEARAAFAALGDTIQRELISRPAEVRAMEARLSRSFTSAAREVAADHPRLRPRLTAFLRRQRRAATLLSGPLRPVLWLARRG